MIFVSRKALPFIGLVSVESEPGRQGAPQCAQALQRLLASVVPRDLETARAGYRYLDLVTFLEPQGFDYGAGQANGEAVAPLGYVHQNSRSMIYATYVYPLARGINGCAIRGRA